LKVKLKLSKLLLKPLNQEMNKILLKLSLMWSNLLEITNLMLELLNPLKKVLIKLSKLLKMEIKLKLFSMLKILSLQLMVLLTKKSVLKKDKQLNSKKPIPWFLP